MLSCYTGYMDKKAQIIFRLPPKVAKKFKVKLAKNGESAQKVLEEKVNEYVS